MLNPSTVQLSDYNDQSLAALKLLNLDRFNLVQLSRIRVSFRRGILRISILNLYPSTVSVTASGLIISLNRTSSTLLRARFAQHGSIYQANVLLSLVMCMPCSRRAPTGACDTIFYATILPGFPPRPALPYPAPRGRFHTVLLVLLLPDFAYKQTLCINDVGVLQIRGPRLQVHHNCFHSEVSIYLDFFFLKGVCLKSIIVLPVDLGKDDA